MPRRPSIYWDESAKAWRSDSGERTKNRWRKSIYFHDLPPSDRGKREAERLLADYIKERDRREEAATESGLNPTLWEGVFRPFLRSFKLAVEKDDREAVSYQTHRTRRGPSATRCESGERSCPTPVNIESGPPKKLTWANVSKQIKTVFNADDDIGLRLIIVYASINFRRQGVFALHACPSLPILPTLGRSSI